MRARQTDPLDAIKPSTSEQRGQVLGGFIEGSPAPSRRKDCIQPSDEAYRCVTQDVLSSPVSFAHEEKECTTEVISMEITTSAPDSTKEGRGRKGCWRGVYPQCLQVRGQEYTPEVVTKSLISAEELLRYCNRCHCGNPNTRSPPSEPPTSESQTKSHFQAPQLPSSARALTRVILSSSPGLRGNRPVLCLAVSDMTPEMEMKPWIFIRRGRCPQRPSPGHPHSPSTPVPLKLIVGTAELPLPPERLSVPAGHI
ncbi:unnamed protein product [Tetraodon nigroviridis]|uniref:(spotted green pufferfish) hypothetical protein n=1 Tax=Tetraodon nigroviridis TaxID=99883 RepID=Q4RP69_TETNG|nr:unnamed protein product [Tetraodon nigroviridis]